MRGLDATERAVLERMYASSTGRIWYPTPDELAAVDRLTARGIVVTQFVEATEFVFEESFPTPIARDVLGWCRKVEGV